MLPLFCFIVAYKQALDLEDLAELGVGLRIHRKRLLRVVAQALQAEVGRENNQPRTVDYSEPCSFSRVDMEEIANSKASATARWFGHKLRNHSPLSGNTASMPKYVLNGALPNNLCQRGATISQYLSALDSLIQRQHQHVLAWINTLQKHKCPAELGLGAMLSDEHHFAQLFSLVRVNTVILPAEATNVTTRTLALAPVSTPLDCSEPELTHT